MTEKKLSTGRKVIINDLTIDQIDDLRDIPEVYFIGEEERTIRFSNKAKTAWIRCGLGGGEFENWKPNGVAPPDHVLKQMTQVERDELILLIQGEQAVNPKKPSSSD